jgi:hypothetical protein
MLKTPDAPIIPQQYIHDALAQIGPAADRRAACINRIELAFILVQWAKETEQLTPARRREQFRAVAKALRALEAALTGDVLFFWRPGFPREEIMRRRKFYEGLAGLMLVRRKSGPRGDRARSAAVREARELLVMFGGTPTRTRGKACTSSPSFCTATRTPTCFRTYGITMTRPAWKSLMKS